MLYRILFIFNQEVFFVNSQWLVEEIVLSGDITRDLLQYMVVNVGLVALLYYFNTCKEATPAFRGWRLWNKEKTLYNA